MRVSAPPVARLPDATASAVPQEVPAGAPAARLHELDAMRSVLMLLGVVLHAANPYRIDAHWLVVDASRSPVLEAIAVAIHAFRMPAFFVVAGYFSMLLLRRQPPAAFLRERLRRTLLPTLAVLLSFNLLQVWFLAPAVPAERFVQAALLPALQRGDWLGHLWFLVYLALYCCVLAALWPHRPRPDGGRGPGWADRPQALAVLLGVVALVPLASAVAAHLVPALAEEFAGTLNPEELLDHAPFFAVGCLLHADARLLRRFSRAGPRVWLGAGAAGAVLWLLPAHGGLAAAALRIVARAALDWGLVRMVFAGFARWAGRPSPAFRYLSDASYSIYLFHHLFVVLVATALLPLHWPALGKCALVLLVATAVPLAMHHALVRPHAAMRWLFNGRALDDRGR